MADLTADPVEADEDTMAYARPEDISVVREFVARRATALGLPARRVDLLKLAISELATNTLQHTAGGGRVRVWTQPGQVVCDVVDSGPDRIFRDMPEPDAVRGRGLAIVRKVADDLTTAIGPDGTLVRIRMNL